MPSPTLNTDTSRHLSGLLNGVASAIGEALRSLIDADILCREGSLDLTTTGTWMRQLSGPSILVNGSLGKGLRGRIASFVLDASTAATLSGHLMMAPNDAIEERRAAGSMSDEDLEAFGDVANVICSGADAALRNSLPTPVDLRLKDLRRLEPDPVESALHDEPCLRYTFSIAVSNHPESSMHIILDTATAELWNSRPIDTVDRPSPSGETLEDIPAAPIRGTLGAYVIDHEVMDVVRRACRRVGLDVERHPTCAIPNPAAHRDQFVLMDITAGEERRFEWCKRLAESGDIKTVLIIHHPSKPRVLQGFVANADAILGWPLFEADLSHKLETLLEGRASSPEGCGGE